MLISCRVKLKLIFYYQKFNGKYCLMIFTLNQDVLINYSKIFWTKNKGQKMVEIICSKIWYYPKKANKKM